MSSAKHVTGTGIQVHEGIITSAFGATKYIELSVDLALSVREYSALPVSLITSESGARHVTTRYPGLFEHIVVSDRLESLAPNLRLVAAKIDAIANSPYQRTIFLDSDMVCRRDPSFLLEGVVSGEFRVFGRLHSRDTCADISHHGIPVLELFDAFDLDCYVHSSLGAFAFTREGGDRVAALMTSEEPAWRERVKPMRESLPAEILFGLLGDRTQVAFYNLPGRFYQKQDMSFRWSDDVTCLHSAPMRHREALRLLAGIVSRRRRSGFPVSPTLYWVSEILNRRAEQAGKSRRQARFISNVNDRFLNRSARKRPNIV